MTKGRSVSPEYSRYINSPGWKKSFRRWLALHLLFGSDAVIPFLKAHHVEHLSYKRIDFQNCKGYEVPFLDIVPLNRFIHLSIITPIKDVLRRMLGRRIGNAVVAYFLRCCLLFWYTVFLWTFVFWGRSILSLLPK